MAPTPRRTSRLNPEKYTAKQFFLEDYGRTLFPLNTNKLLVEHGEAELRAHIEQILSADGAFLPQRRVYAAKDAMHLRRTVKLDPVAEFFIYDLIYRNRNLFRKPHSDERAHFGYRFNAGRPIPASESYKTFKNQVWIQNMLHDHFVGFDIASYFNSLYHHDLADWFTNLGADAGDVAALNKFLRQTNAGRSIDCLPHGIYPTKMIGNDLLRYVEENHALKSKVIIRFMDDFYLFDDDESIVRSDFVTVQRLLGQKGLSVNPRKTTTVQPRTEQASTRVDDIKKRLLKRRRKIVSRSTYDDVESFVELGLSDAELEYLTSILNAGYIEEEDAELILTVMRGNAANVESRLEEIMTRFPHLAKNVYIFCQNLPDYGEISQIALRVATRPDTSEYQLFWIGMMLEDYLLGTTFAPQIIDALFSHANASEVSKAKILEISDNRYGLPDLRSSYLSSGQSDWLSWSSAVGSRSLRPAARNHRLDYFKNSSPMNALIGRVIRDLP